MKCCQREENKAKKGEESKWGKALIFLCERTKSTYISSHKLDGVPGVWRREFIHDVSFSSWLLTSTVLCLWRSVWQLTNFSVQFLEISATQRMAPEYLNQKGSRLLLWWQSLGPARHRFLHKPFLILDFHVLWLHLLVLTLNHGYVFFLGWQNNRFRTLNSVGCGRYVLVLLLSFPIFVRILCVPQSRDRRNPGFTSLFLVSPDPLDLQHHVFISSIYLKGGCWPPACLHPSISATSFHLGWTLCRGDDQGKAHKLIFQLKKVLKTVICVKGELLLFGNGRQAKWKETGTDFLRFSVAPCPTRSPSSCQKPFTRGW